MIKEPKKVEIDRPIDITINIAEMASNDAHQDKKQYRSIIGDCQHWNEPILTGINAQ